MNLIVDLWDTHKHSKNITLSDKINYSFIILSEKLIKSFKSNKLYEEPLSTVDRVKMGLE